jgi:Domain of unknown function (DUF4184)
MPFTVSHVAAVLPLHKPLRRLGLLSAAAIGAMVPDLDLMLPARLPREQTHGFLALLTFCLPVGLGAWALFQALVKPALIEVLPDRVYVRLTAEHLGPRLRSVKVWFYAASTVLLGALTHIVWDGFTHENGGGARMLPVQHGSSVLGVAAVLAALWIWVRHARRHGPVPERRLTARERHRWLAVYVSIPVLQVMAAVPQIPGGLRFYSTPVLMHLAITGLYSAILALVFTSALVRRRLLILANRMRSPTRENAGCC